MRLRIISIAAFSLLASCSAFPTAPATPSDHAVRQSQYVGPGSGGDQHP